MKLVLATKNQGKIREFQEAFHRLGIDCISIRDISNVSDPIENGNTFIENAKIKALYYMNACGLPCLADDSGLDVDILNGAPGIYSARYAGTHGDDEANNQKLISQLQGVPMSKRGAQYVCALVLVYPDGRMYEAEGICNGLIQDEPRGTEGFGYDPYFYVPKFRKTMAELTIEEKELISHRGRALRQLIGQIEKME